MSEFLLKSPVTFRIFLVVISRFSISRIVQSRIRNVGVSTGSAKVLWARCLLYALSSLLHIFRTLFLYSVVTLSLFKLPTYPRFSSCPRYLYDSPSLIGLTHTLLIAKFCADCLIKPFSIFRNAHLLYPNFILISLENVVTKSRSFVAFWRFEAYSFRSSTKNKWVMLVLRLLVDPIL